MSSIPKRLLPDLPLFDPSDITKILDEPMQMLLEFNRTLGKVNQTVEGFGKVARRLDEKLNVPSIGSETETLAQSAEEQHLEKQGFPQAERKLEEIVRLSEEVKEEIPCESCRDDIKIIGEKAKNWKENISKYNRLREEAYKRGISQPTSETLINISKEIGIDLEAEK